MSKKINSTIPRKDRLSGKELTSFAQTRCWNSVVFYQHSPTGWYLGKPGYTAVFIGANWMLARDYIAKMPIEPMVQRHTLISRIRSHLATFLGA